jgi:GNAT superfamily N-acetyltransferase
MGPALCLAGMTANVQIRLYDHARDMRSFRALNFRTFYESIPKQEAVSEDQFSRHYEWLITHFAPQDKGRSTVFVAEVDGQYAGHIWLGTQTDFFTRRVDPWIFDLSVVAPFRGRGIARALHDHAIAFLRKRGSRVVGLQVMAGNPGAAAMYAKLGYLPRATSMKLELRA